MARLLTGMRLPVTFCFLVTTTALPVPSQTSQSGVSGVLFALVVCLGGLVFPEQTVAQSPLTVSIEHHHARADEPVDVPIRGTDFSNVGAISLIVTYDPEVLDFDEGPETSSLIADTPRENFSANVVEPGELRISWFDLTGSSPLNIDDETLLTITFHRYTGGKSPVAFAEGSEISNIKGKPVEAKFQDGRVIDRP